jgi:hypothetical protein
MKARKLNGKPKPKPAPSAECEYCENPARYSLDPAREEEDSVFWHYETVTYCRDARRSRVRCRKNVS